MMRNITIILLGVVFLCCFKKKVEEQESTVRISCSERFAPLIQILTDEFRVTDSDVSFAINQNNHEQGFSDLITKKSDLLITDNKLLYVEISDAKSHGFELVEEIIAYDGIALIIRTNNLMEVLSVNQIRSIFTGKATNFKEFVGFDLEITVCYNENDEKRRYFFWDKILDRNDITEDAVRFASDEDVIDFVSTTDNAIGIVGLASAIKSVGRIKSISINDGGDKPIPPSPAYIQYGVYPMSFPVYLIDSNKLSEEQNSFVRFCLSRDRQKQLLQYGFFPIADKH